MSISTHSHPSSPLLKVVGQLSGALLPSAICRVHVRTRKFQVQGIESSRRRARSKLHSALHCTRCGKLVPRSAIVIRPLVFTRLIHANSNYLTRNELNQIPQRSNGLYLSPGGRVPDNNRCKPSDSDPGVQLRFSVSVRGTGKGETRAAVINVRVVSAFIVHLDGAGP